ncbi:MAG: hypothetical protein AUJ12_04700 [Alphaproteobacteria bacterium CG1_02_46_17]|nr:MAG: hypothetical protein AUJ12_04700 [Alphaproteobacteria bacterium CG1_02_46_17]
MVTFTHNRLDVYTSETGRSLLSRVSDVKGWLRREGGWTVGSMAIGMAANILTAKVALVAAPVLLGVAGGVVAANIATTGFRMVREAAQADQKKQIEQGLEKPSISSLMWKHAREDDILNKTFIKRVAMGVGVSALTMGTIRNFSTISGFFSDLFNSQAAPAAIQAVPSIDVALDCNDPQTACGTVGVATPADINPDITNNTNVSSNIMEAEQTLPEAPAVLSPVDRARDLLSGQDVSDKTKNLVEAMVGHPDDAQKIKDVAQALVRSHEDLAKDLYKQAIDRAVESGQKTAWGQASIDLAYLSYKTDPAAALQMMQGVVDHSKGAVHNIAKEFVDQWKGINPTSVAPVDVVQNRMVEEAARKLAEESALQTVEQEVVPQGVSSSEFDLAQNALTQKYVHHELVDFITKTTGVIPDAQVDRLELARQISPSNPEALLKSLEQNAPQLDQSKMAFSCVADIPRTTSGPIEVLTKCDALKETMDVGDFGTVRDAQDTSPRGLRHLFKSAANACTKVVDCIDRFVTRDAVPDMAREVRMSLK